MKFTVFLLLAIQRASSTLTVHFNETFHDNTNMDRWGSVDTYTSESSKFRLRSGGLQTLVDNSYYNLKANFAPFSNIGKVLTVTYMLKVMNPVSCNRDFLTIQSWPDMNILLQFGPDSCKEVYNIKTMIVDSDGIWYENKKTVDPQYQIDKKIKYSLNLYPNSTYSVAINDKSVQSGSLYTDFGSFFDQQAPSGENFAKWSNIGVIGFDGNYMRQAGSVFSDILLMTVD
jgi:hypothetical protein